jgi:hypothetical protein
MGAAVGATPSSRRFLVLARRAFTESLAYQGTMAVGAGGDSAALAKQQFGDGWLEMVLAPAETVTWVIEPQGGTPA